MTESGVGSFSTNLRGFAFGFSEGSDAEFERLVDLDFRYDADVVEDVDGRRDEFGLMSCSGRDAGPSKPPIEGISRVGVDMLALVATVNESVENGVRSAEMARSNVPVLRLPLRDLEACFALFAFCRSFALSSSDKGAVGTSVNGIGLLSRL